MCVCIHHEANWWIPNSLCPVPFSWCPQTPVAWKTSSSSPKHQERTGWHAVASADRSQWAIITMYVCIYIYICILFYIYIYYIPMDPNTVWEGTWPQKIIPQVLPKEALSVHLVRPTQKTHLLFPADLSDDWKTWPASGTPILQTDLSGLGYLGLLNSIYRV